MMKQLSVLWFIFMAVFLLTGCQSASKKEVANATTQAPPVAPKPVEAEPEEDLPEPDFPVMTDNLSGDAVPYAPSDYVSTLSVNYAKLIHMPLYDVLLLPSKHQGNELTALDYAYEKYIKPTGDEDGWLIVLQGRYLLIPNENGASMGGMSATVYHNRKFVARFGISDNRLYSINAKGKEKYEGELPQTFTPSNEPLMPAEYATTEYEDFNYQSLEIDIPMSDIPDGFCYGDFGRKAAAYISSQYITQMKDLKTPTIRLFGSSYKNGQETCEFAAGNVIGFSEFEPRAYYSVAKNGNISSLRPRPVAIEKLPDNLPEPKPEKTKSQDAMGMHIDAMEFKDFKLAILNQHGSTPLETFAQITPAKAGQYLANKLKNNKEGSLIRAKEVTTVASSWELVSLPETASKKVPGLVIVDIATIDNQNAYVFVCDNASLFAISESGDVYHFEPSDGDIGKMPKSAKVPHILKDNEVSKLQDDKRYANFNGNDYARITSGDNYSVLKLEDTEVETLAFPIKNAAQGIYDNLITSFQPQNNNGWAMKYGGIVTIQKEQAYLFYVGQGRNYRELDSSPYMLKIAFKAAVSESGKLYQYKGSKPVLVTTLTADAEL
ncbi:MAG: hypothetical protein IIY06_11925 [Proteobacteria bacterium]|nr:hypothetical protein [Pseudomonadota bacterium]